MTPLLTIEQVAELLDCSRDTVTERLARNELPGGPVLRYLVRINQTHYTYSDRHGPSLAASAAQASATTCGTATARPVARLVPVR